MRECGPTKLPRSTETRKGTAFATKTPNHADGIDVGNDDTATGEVAIRMRLSASNDGVGGILTTRGPAVLGLDGVARRSRIT